ADVGVERDVVDLVLQVLESRSIPADPIRTRAKVTGAAGDQLDGRIRPAHPLRGFEREFGVILGIFVSELPRAIDFVTQAPILHAIWLFMTIFAALLGPIGIARLVNVFDPLTRVLDRAQTRVDA